MKKYSLWVLAFLILIPIPSNAQNSPSMRSMAVLQLFQYGQAVYDRGDYSQAAVIFKRLLSIDPSHQGAIKYAVKLNTKGEHISIPATAIPAADVQVKTVTQQISKQVVKDRPVVTKKAVELPIHDPTDLKGDINQANQAIEQLKEQVAYLRQQLAEEPKGLPYLDSNN